MAVARIYRAALAALAVLLAGLAAASAATAPPLPPTPAAIPSPYILVDLDTGAVLAERNAEERWYPASLTKLMTAYLTFEALSGGKLRPTSPVVESAVALAEPPSKMGFSVGTIFTIDNALKMLIVKSANDVAVALGEAVAGNKPAFVVSMNSAAARLGMSESHFMNPNGLHDDEHFSTARDLAILARRIWTDYPQYRELFGIPAIKAGKLVLHSENSLLERYKGANGMKTGYTCSSGFNMVVTATRGGRTLLVVVLGAASSKLRADLAAGLLDRGFAGGAGQVASSLASFRSASSVAGPVDMHETVCKRHAPIEGEAEGDDNSLGPPVKIMEPVKVFTGGADTDKPGATQASVKAADAVTNAAPATTKAVPPQVADLPPAKAATGAASRIPIPRPKPTLVPIGGVSPGPAAAPAATAARAAPSVDGPKLQLAPVSGARD